jgi:hypothetical protein
MELLRLNLATTRHQGVQMINSGPRTMYSKPLRHNYQKNLYTKESLKKDMKVLVNLKVVRFHLTVYLGKI